MLSYQQHKTQLSSNSEGWWRNVQVKVTVDSSADHFCLFYLILNADGYTDDKTKGLKNPIFCFSSITILLPQFHQGSFGVNKTWLVRVDPWNDFELWELSMVEKKHMKLSTAVFV